VTARPRDEPAGPSPDPQHLLEDRLAHRGIQRDVLAGDDQDAIGDVLRALNDADLRHVAEHGRLDPTGTEATSATAQRLARRHVLLRAQGHAIVVHALHDLGHRYTGTGGWHILPCAVPSTTGPDVWLGFVNIAAGIAATTDVVLPPELVAALTVPDQPAGPQVSGAVAWSAGDPGEARRAQAPEGWTQLGVDVRADAATDPVEGTIPRIGDWCRIEYWCLRTCYGAPGQPGYDRLDYGATGWREGHLPIGKWPRRGELAAPLRTMRATAAAGLCRIAATFADNLGIAEQVVAALGAGDRTGPATAPDQAAICEAAVAVSRLGTGHLNPGTAARNTEHLWPPATEWLVRQLAEHDIDELAVLAAAGDDHLRWTWTYLLADMAGLIVLRDAEPVARTLHGVISGGTDTGLVLTSKRQIVQDLTRPTLTHLVDVLLRPAGAIAAAAREAALAAYAEHGPYAVDIPVEPPVRSVRIQRPAGDDTPVGVTEIAAAAGVQPNTVEVWRRRHTAQDGHPFPQPAWPVGGRPAWRWGEVRTWLERTGRLPGIEHPPREATDA
jgi:hypothetical protein